MIDFLKNEVAAMTAVSHAKTLEDVSTVWDPQSPAGSTALENIGGSIRDQGLNPVQDT